MFQQTYAVPFEMKSFGEAGSFCGYASVFHVVDSQQDALQPGAFAATLQKWRRKQRLPWMLWQHDIQKPIGRWKTIQENSTGLLVSGKPLLDVQQGKEAYSLMKAGRPLPGKNFPSSAAGPIPVSPAQTHVSLTYLRRQLSPCALYGAPAGGGSAPPFLKTKKFSSSMKTPGIITCIRRFFPGEAKRRPFSVTV